MTQVFEKEIGSREISTIVLFCLIGAAIAMLAEESLREAPAGFTTLHSD
jgi:hypothetical protein